MKVLVGLVGLVIVPPIPPIMLQLPIPEVGVLAARVTVVKLQVAASV